MNNDRAREAWESEPGDRLREKMRERKARPREVLGGLAQRGIEANKLTGSAQWDWMLREIHQRLDAANAALEPLMKQFSDPRAVFSVDELLIERQKAVSLRCEIQTLEWLSGLPEQARKEGKAALEEMPS